MKWFWGVTASKKILKGKSHLIFYILSRLTDVKMISPPTLCDVAPKQSTACEFSGFSLYLSVHVLVQLGYAAILVIKKLTCLLFRKLVLNRILLFVEQPIFNVEGKKPFKMWIFSITLILQISSLFASFNGKQGKKKISK